MSDAWRTGQFDQSEQEPLGPLANLIDIMLVFACGLIAALVAISPELAGHFKTESQQHKTSQRIESLGKELASPPKTLQQKVQSNDGYQALGQVYQDPKTGKLILISTTNDKND